MVNTRKVTDHITWVGADEHRLALFENLFPIPRGVSYNSYLIRDEKNALLDTVDSAVTRQFIENIQDALDGQSLDYLVINHMEPDHCANIEELMVRFPEMKIVCNKKTLDMIHQFYEMNLEEHTILVKEGDKLELGSHTLAFYFAPMVHWPEVMVSFEETEKVLFSADAFGSFGALNGALFNDEMDFDKDWLDDARRYYSNIVGKYGPQVQSALKKLSALPIEMICPLHGPVWRTDLAYFLNKYDLWSRYEPEEKAAVILYGSMYGNTENAAGILARRLREKGVKKVAMYDVSSTHISTLISEIFRASHLVLAAPTYNNGIYPAMSNLLHDMKALCVQNRTVGLMENGTWAPTCGKQVKAALEELKNMRILEPMVSIKSSLKEASLAQIDSLAEAMAEELR